MYLGLKIIGKTLVGTQWKLIIGIRGATKCSSKDVKSKSGGFSGKPYEFVNGHAEISFSLRC